MRREADLERWRYLYQITSEIKQLKPWEFLWDMDLIAIELPDHDDPVFCSIMGRGGDCFGIGVYVGVEGLADIMWLSDEQASYIPPQFMMFEQTSLSCYFGNREEIPPEQKKLMKDLELKFRGKGQWIYFESFQKGYYPFMPDADEVELLIETYENLLVVLKDLIDGELHVAFEQGEILLRQYDKQTKQWTNMTAPLPLVHKEFPVIELQDQLLKKRMKNQNMTPNIIEMDLIYLGTKMKDKEFDRPINPLLFVAADATNGMVLSCDLISPNQDEVQEILNFFVNYVMERGRMRKIKLRNPKIAGVLQSVCEYCGIKIEAKCEEMEAIDSFLKTLIQSDDLI